jgi:hypothetical protein
MRNLKYKEQRMLGSLDESTASLLNLINASIMKAPGFLALCGVALTMAACEHVEEQQGKPKPQVTGVTSSTIQVQHDTATFNKVMNAPTAPDSLPTH